ncbi:MAG: hypothetical protein KGM44_04565 [bacterium]|nr:hypothetical protein [bacterium]
MRTATAIASARLLAADETAASLAEYAIVAVLVSIVACAILLATGKQVAQFFTGAANGL